MSYKTFSNKYLHTYVLNKKKQRVGVVVATMGNNGDAAYLGWSRCNARAGDTFDRELGLKIALGRALEVSVEPVPNSLAAQYAIMKERAKKYFKDAQYVSA